MVNDVFVLSWANTSNHDQTEVLGVFRRLDTATAAAVSFWHAQMQLEYKEPKYAHKLAECLAVTGFEWTLDVPSNVFYCGDMLWNSNFTIARRPLV